MFSECSHQVPNVPSNQEEGKSWVSCICTPWNQSHSRRLISILGKNITKSETKPWKSLQLLCLWCGAAERERHTHSYKRDKTKKACGNTKVQDLCHHAFDEIRQSIWSFSHSWGLWRWDQIQAQWGATHTQSFLIFFVVMGVKFDRTWTKLLLKFPPSQQLKTLFLSHTWKGSRPFWILKKLHKSLTWKKRGCTCVQQLLSGWRRRRRGGRW